jgi:hypothetical protein
MSCHTSHRLLTLFSLLLLLLQIRYRCLCLEESSPIFYWLNLDRSDDRRAYMSSHLQSLGLQNQRIPAVRWGDLDIPSDAHPPNRCTLQTTETEAAAAPDLTFNPPRGHNTHRVFITGLCGRPKSTKKELAVTVSHMIAMRTAVNNNQSMSRFAVILEDDMRIAFDGVDWNGLIASAPQDFSVLQLITSNTMFIKKLWHQYKDGTGDVADKV